MICELLRTTKDGQVPIAIIRFQNGEISVDPLGKNKSQEYIDDILEVKGELPDGTILDSKVNPELWFNNLPRMFNGAYVRARMVPSA